MPFVSNPGSGGATFESRTDATGYEWIPSVVSYLTHASTGEEDPDVLQYVDSTHGLPVLATLAANSELESVGAVVEVGTIVNPVDVQCGNPADLKATVTIAAAQTIAATQSGTWTVGLSAAQTLATVTTVGTVTTITNPVTVAQATAANLKATVNIAASQTLDAVTTVGTITNPVAVTKSGTWNLDGITNAISVQQSNPANLKVTALSSAETSTIYNGTTALTPKFAKVDVSSSGDNQIVAAVSGKKIRVLCWSFTADGTVKAKWRSGTTDLTGARSLIQYASAGGGYCEIGHFETAVNTALNLNLNAAINCAGSIAYIEV